MDKDAEQTIKNEEIKLNKIFRTKNQNQNLLFILFDAKSYMIDLGLKSNINQNFKTDIILIRNINDKIVKIHNIIIARKRTNININFRQYRS